MLWVAFIIFCSIKTAWSRFQYAEIDAGHERGHEDPQNPTHDKIGFIVEKLEEWRRNGSMSRFERPCVTLTFAQSVDGKIAVHNEKGLSSNLQLSSPDSLLLTHALRAIHDGILIGGNTWSTDNPRLTNRRWGIPNSRRQPRPIVLDPDLKRARKYLNGKSMRMQNPIVCCSHEAARCWNNDEVEVLGCDVKENGWLDLNDVLMRLWHRCGIKTLMVEGGASVLTSFILENLVDILCITIAPKFLGEDGIAPKIPRTINLGPIRSQFVTLGADAILVSEMLQE